MNVWLDLEDTIITTWAEGVLLRPSRIKQWLDEQGVKDIHIWSFAIWDETDKQIFLQSGMKDMIESALERSIDEFPSVKEMQAVIFKHERMMYESRTEFMQLNGKQWSFIKYCLGEYPGQCCILIDDAVSSLHIKDMKSGTEIQLINVGDLC